MCTAYTISPITETRIEEVPHAAFNAGAHSTTIHRTGEDEAIQKQLYIKVCVKGGKKFVICMLGLLGVCQEKLLNV